jgi:hypothetical protein
MPGLPVLQEGFFMAITLAAVFRKAAGNFFTGDCDRPKKL